MICVPISSSSRGSSALTEPCVPTDMNTGVSITPRVVVRRPSRARDSESFLSSSNDMRAGLSHARPAEANLHRFVPGVTAGAGVNGLLSVGARPGLEKMDGLPGLRRPAHQLTGIQPGDQPAGSVIPCEDEDGSGSGGRPALADFAVSNDDLAHITGGSGGEEVVANGQQLEHFTAEVSEAGNLFRAIHPTQADPAIATRRRRLPAIAQKGHGEHRAVMLAKGADHLARGGVENARGAIAARGGQARAI